MDRWFGWIDGSEDRMVRRIGNSITRNTTLKENNTRRIPRFGGSVCSVNQSFDQPVIPHTAKEQQPNLVLTSLLSGVGRL
jgi:hypothetical protein